MKEKSIISELEGYSRDIAIIAKIDYEIVKKELERERLKNDPPISGSNFSVNGDIRPNGFVQSSIENQIASLDEEIYILQKKKDILESKIKMIDKMLGTLKSHIELIVRERYIENISIREIADKRDRQTKSISRTLRNAIKKLNDLYLKDNF